MLRRTLAAATALAITTLLTGCDTDVRTTTVVRSTTQADTTVTVTFDGPAAQALDGDPKLQDQLLQLFKRYTGKVAETTRDGEALSYSAALDDAKASTAGSVTGIAAVELAGDDPVTIRSEFVEPTKLLAAVRSSVSKRADADAMTAAVLAAVSVSYQVRFPGAVTAAVGPVEAVRDSRTATFTQRLIEYRSGPVTVTGSLSGGRSPLQYLLAAAAIVALGWVILRRRR